MLEYFSNKRGLIAHELPLEYMKYPTEVIINAVYNGPVSEAMRKHAVQVTSIEDHKEDVAVVVDKVKAIAFKSNAVGYEDIRDSVCNYICKELE